MFGSDSRWSSDWKGFIGISTSGAPASARVTSWAATSTTSPSASSRTASRVSAMPSTRPTSTASLAGRTPRPSRRHGGLDRAPAGLGDGGDRGDRVVLHLVAHVAGDVLAAPGDGSRRPDVGAGAM